MPLYHFLGIYLCYYVLCHFMGTTVLIMGYFQYLFCIYFVIGYFDSVIHVPESPEILLA